MGYSTGWDSNWKRDIGYGVPCLCDDPSCKEEIDRGLSYVCGGDAFGGERGCGLFFCSSHLFYYGPRLPQLCRRCRRPSGKPFAPKADVAEWIKHKLTDPSWAQWREESPDEVRALKTKEIAHG